MPRTAMTIRPSDDADRLLARLANSLGIGKGAVIELAVRQMARQEGFSEIDGLRQSLADAEQTNRHQFELIRVLIFAAGGRILVTRDQWRIALDYEWTATPDASNTHDTIYSTGRRTEQAGC